MQWLNLNGMQWKFYYFYWQQIFVIRFYVIIPNERSCCKNVRNQQTIEHLYANNDCIMYQENPRKIHMYFFRLQLRRNIESFTIYCFSVLRLDKDCLAWNRNFTIFTVIESAFTQSIISAEFSQFKLSFFRVFLSRISFKYKTLKIDHFNITAYIIVLSNPFCQQSNLLHWKIFEISTEIGKMISFEWNLWQGAFLSRNQVRCQISWFNSISCFAWRCIGRNFNSAVYRFNVSFSVSLRRWKTVPGDFISPKSCL